MKQEQQKKEEEKKKRRGKEGNQSLFLLSTVSVKPNNSVFSFLLGSSMVNKELR